MIKPDYSSIYFGKLINNLEYQDIVNFFIEPKEETTRIEFKSATIYFFTQSR